MKQCQNELLQKKNSIIQKLQSTKTSISNMIKTDPRAWDDECFNFELNSKATLIFKADIFVQDPAERATNRKLEEMEAKRRAKEEQDRVERAKKRELEEMEVKKKAKEKEDQGNIMTKPIQIFVKIYGRGTRTIVLFLEPSDTVKNLKDMIQVKEGIPPNEQKLSNSRSMLRDELTLYENNITNNTTLSLNW